LPPTKMPSATTTTMPSSIFICPCPNTRPCTCPDPRVRISRDGGKTWTREYVLDKYDAAVAADAKAKKVAALRAELALLGVIEGNCNCDCCADSISRCRIPVPEDCEFYVAPK
jgi:hypothetical protein